MRWTVVMRKAPEGSGRDEVPAAGIEGRKSKSSVQGGYQAVGAVVASTRGAGSELALHERHEEPHETELATLRSRHVRERRVVTCRPAAGIDAPGAGDVLFEDAGELRGERRVVGHEGGLGVQP